MEELFSIEEPLSDDDEELWLDDEDAEFPIRPVTLTLCPTQFCRLIFLPSETSVYEEFSLRAISFGVWLLDLLLLLIAVFSLTSFRT